MAQIFLPNGPEMSVQTVEIERTSASEQQRVGPSVPGWLTPGRFALVLVLMIAAAFPDVIFGGKTFFFRDYALFGYPLAHYHREAFWRGEIPLWNPLSNCGIPYVAQWNTMVFYPLSLIYLLLPLPWSLGWFCLFHLFLAGLGMYYLSLRWTSNRFAAGWAGISFGFSGLALSFLIWPNNIAALGWMPWVLWLSEKAWNGRRADLAKGAAVGALQMLSGAPEVILFTWIIAGVIWIYQFGKGPRRMNLALRSTSLIALICGLSAVQLLPFLDLLRHSQRNGEIWGSSWSMRSSGWANLLVPMFQTVPTASGVQMQPGQGWTSSYYLGITVLLLAVLAVCKVRKPLNLLLGGLSLLALVLALGDHGYVYTWLRRVLPAIQVMRFPVKLVVVAAGCVPLLAAWAMAAMEQRWWQQKWRHSIIWSAAVMGMVALAIVYYSSRFPSSDEVTSLTTANGFTRVVILVAFVFLLVIMPRSSESQWQRVVQSCLLLLAWFDLVSHAPRLNPTVEADAYRGRVRAGVEWKANSRLALSVEAMERFHTTFVSNSYASVIGVRAGLYKNCNLIEGISKVDGFYSLYLPEEQEIEYNLYRTSQDVRTGLADFVGIGGVTAESDILEWKPRNGSLQMVTAGQKPVFTPREQTLEGLRGDFDPRKTVFLEPFAASALRATNGASATVISFKASPLRVEAVVEASEPCLVVIAQTYYHYWKAAVDGVPTRLWRANHAFQAVEIPAGCHEVELVYRDRSFRWGLAVSAVSFLACIGLGGVWYRRDPGN